MVPIARAAPYDTILRFLQTNGPTTESQPVDIFEDDAKTTPSWVDEQDLLAEYQSSQAERASDLNLKALEKRRAATSLRQYAEGIDLELKKIRKKGGDPKTELKLTAQLEANLARVALLLKEADLLQEKANEAREKLEKMNLNEDNKNILLQDCDMLKIGPVFYTSRIDNINEKDKKLLMAKLTGNSLVLYHDKVPQLTFYLIDVTLPTTSVENAPTCFSFGYRGTQQALCAATEISCHTWMNALAEAWFCKNYGVKGTLINLHKIKPKASIMSHAVKNENDSNGLVNMEVFVDDDNKTHLLVNGKEKPVSSVKNVLDLNSIINETKAIKRESQVKEHAAHHEKKEHPDDHDEEQPDEEEQESEDLEEPEEEEE
ncbi:hypothetical protein BdWA1_001456 [Babesia duncani]|uniref:PH domain-containing protein n=1 Tax=Babesia duncani TaxID=323732 RepID=A0AAD9PPF4_9APIC|nr:hypothetical protein BdWA1_001456 [Babesia duncani]